MSFFSPNASARFALPETGDAGSTSTFVEFRSPTTVTKLHLAFRMRVESLAAGNSVYFLYLGTGYIAGSDSVDGEKMLTLKLQTADGNATSVTAREESAANPVEGVWTSSPNIGDDWLGVAIDLTVASPHCTMTTTTTSGAAITVFDQDLSASWKAGPPGFTMGLNFNPGPTQAKSILFDDVLLDAE
jgi:hypothetical protein